MTIGIDMSDKIVLICGASRSGISGATARLLTEAGAKLAVADVNPQALDETVSDVEALGGECVGLQVDLLDPDQADGVVGKVLDAFGALDCVANVAGGTRAEEWMPLETTPTKMFRETLNFNLEYVFRVCRDAAAVMIERGTAGTIVNVSSVSALSSAPFHGPYGAAKSGMIALTRTMAFEWFRYGIRANAVLPGAVPSERVLTMERNRGLKPEDVGIVYTPTESLANAILFLLSERSAGITGQSLAVDSGLSTKFCAGNRTLQKPGG
jgi:NAD(P)-dependent dehydrogenase (short-subunit alcohol dehydrogenase family)